MPFFSACAIFRLHFWSVMQWILLFRDADCQKSRQSNLWYLWGFGWGVFGWWKPEELLQPQWGVYVSLHFLQITSPTTLAFKSVIFFHFRLILQCQWQGEVSIPQIYAIIKSLNCQDYNKGLSYHRNMHFKITWCDSRASGGWFFCNTPVVTVCCHLANT